LIDRINPDYLMHRGPMIEAIPLRDQVADILRKMILRGELERGQIINERKLSQLLDVSTTPVKEALRTLQTEGLVHTLARKGSIVSDFPIESALQAVYMRSALEGVAAFFAAQNPAPDMLEKLEEILGRNQALLNSPKAAAAIGQNNLAFHETLRMMSGNSYLIKLINNMLSIDLTIGKPALGLDENEPRRGQAEHLAIVEAVRSRNGQLAEQLMNGHIRRVATMVLENLDRI